MTGLFHPLFVSPVRTHSIDIDDFDGLVDSHSAPGLFISGVTFVLRFRQAGHLRDEILSLYIWEVNHSTMAEKARPLGVTIIGILWILAGLLTAIGGGVGGAALAIIGLGSLGAAVGVILVIIGLVFIALGVGCFKGWPWVWPVGVIFTIIGIVINLLSILSNTASAIIGILIDIIILWYLFQPQVKAWFGAA